MRDTDVLARVDEREFYLLMPETGGVGRAELPPAGACSRQQRAPAARVRGAFRPSSRIGVSTYPHDGTDLSRLLRAAKRRAEMSQRSIVRRSTSMGWRSRVWSTI